MSSAHWISQDAVLAHQVVDLVDDHLGRAEARALAHGHVAVGAAVGTAAARDDGHVLAVRPDARVARRVEVRLGVDQVVGGQGQAVEILDERTRGREDDLAALVSVADAEHVAEVVALRQDPQQLVERLLAFVDDADVDVGVLHRLVLVVRWIRTAEDDRHAGEVFLEGLCHDVSGQSLDREAGDADHVGAEGEDLVEHLVRQLAGGVEVEDADVVRFAAGGGDLADVAGDGHQAERRRGHPQALGAIGLEQQNPAHRWYLDAGPRRRRARGVRGDRPSNSRVAGGNAAGPTRSPARGAKATISFPV